jgi:diguanylate cyclase (GGDEF)-like protein
MPVPPAPLPMNEPARLAALLATGILDTPSDPYFDRLVRMVSVLMDVPVALVSLVDRDRQWFKARLGFDQSQTPRHEAFCAHALHSHDLLVVPDATRDPRFADNLLVTGPTGIRFYAGAPLLLPCGQVAGTLCAIDRRARDITLSERWLLAELAATTVGLITLHSTQMQLDRRTRTDPLTGLNTRTAFLDRLAQRLGREAGLKPDIAVLMLDIAGVGAINALLGYAVGDALLQVAARALAAALPAAATAARVGGVRFAAALEFYDPAALAAMARHVERHVAATLAEAGWHVGVTCAASPCAPGQSDSEFALTLADAALLAAKAGGVPVPAAMASSAG